MVERLELGSKFCNYFDIDCRESSEGENGSERGSEEN